MPNTSVLWLLPSLLLLGGLVILVRRQRQTLSRKDKDIKELSARLAQIQQQLFHDKNELNAILSSMVEGVIVVDKSERILYVSPNVSEMLEMRSRDVISKAYWEVIRHQEINASLKESLQQNKAVNKEIALIGTQDVFFSMQISPVVQEGKLTSVVAVFHDITELKKLVRLRSEFVANVSHELKTPLTSIKGFVETLRDGGVDDKDNARRFLNIIDTQTKHLEQLVEDLLELSSIESKETKLELVPQDIAPVIESALLMHKNAVKAADLTIDVGIAQGLACVTIDRRRMEQVFINLIDNAIKFTPAKGSVSIKAYQEAGFLRVDIADTGVGISSEHINRVFERFYRVDKARSRASGGTGLGLAIVKHIVVAHQGRIEVSSIVDKGSTFSVFLPFIKA